MLFLSPAAMHYIPLLLLHGVSLGYLLLKPSRSRPTWLFCGWLAGMTLMTASQAVARAITVPKFSSYVGWWGGVGGVSLAMIALIQFAYYFPRLRYPREARAALIGSLCFTGLLFGWMAWETLAFPGHLVYTGAVEPYSPRVRWILYSFEHFTHGSVVPRDAGLWISFKVFDIWQIVGNLWVLAIWLRKAVQFSRPADGAGWRRAPAALRHPQGEEARLSRAWALLMLLSPLPVLASALEGANLLPAGLFATVHLLVLFAMVLIYVDYAPEPISFMVRLVGISLVTVLVILGLVSSYTLRTHRRAYDRVRRAELDHVRTLIAAGRLDALPPDVLYVAERSVRGLFAADYRMLAAKPSAPDAAALTAQDTLLREGLARAHYPTRFAVLHEHPWLSLEGVMALEGTPGAGAALIIPEGVTAYRGTTAPLADQVVRYALHAGEMLYEVGFAYRDERVILHRQALPLLGLLMGATVAMVVLFPRFFDIGLVAPLRRLLQGVDRVDRGELDVAVSVLREDEIGHLTHAFNRMVASLRTSAAHLRALNLTLEQRVADRVRDLATLYEIAALIGRTPAPDRLFPAALARIVPAVDGAAGAIFLPEGDDTFALAAHHRLPPTLHAAVAESPAWGQVCEGRDALLIHDRAADPRATALFPGGWPFDSLVGVPIPGPESCLGVLALFGGRPYLFNVEDIELLSSLAEQMGVAIESARLRERAEAALVLEERQRLARDLHDSVTQILYSQVLFADAANKFLGAQQIERASHYLGRLGESAAQALREMRLMIYRLRPSLLAEAGLIGALQRRLEMVEQRAGIQVHLTYEPGSNLPDEIERALYYIAEEALNNALKHAAASVITVAVSFPPGHVCLSVTDSGCGFDVACVSEGLGLQSLQERTEALAGELTVASTPGEGARIEVCLPLPPTA